MLQQQVDDNDTMANDNEDVFSKRNIDKLIARDNVEIVDVDLQPFSTEKLGFIGAYKLLTIELREKNEKQRKVKKILTLFVKSTKPDSNPYEDMVFREECLFYRDFAPRCQRYNPANPWIAKCYLAKDDLVVLEDLKAQGFKVIKRELTLNELRSASACVARFHASSMLLERKLKRPLSRVYEGFFEDKSYITDGDSLRTWITTGIEVAEAVASRLNLDPKYVWMAYNLTMQGVKPQPGENNVLLHADLWCNNIMFREKVPGKEISCRLIDWQLVFYSSYVIDLVQFVYYNTRSDSREQYIPEILEAYHTSLSAVLRDNGYPENEIISLDTVRKDFERKRIIGLVTAVQCLPVLTLNETQAKEYFAHFERYLLVSRKDFVLDGMRLYADYGKRIEEVVEELCEFVRSSCIMYVERCV